MFQSKKVFVLCLLGVLSHRAFVSGTSEIGEEECVGGTSEIGEEECVDVPPEGAWTLASYDKGPEKDAVEILTARHMVILKRETDTAYTGSGVGLLTAAFSGLSAGYQYTYTFLGKYDKETRVLSGAITMWDIHVQDVVWWKYDDGRLVGPAINIVAGAFTHGSARHELDYLG